MKRSSLGVAALTLALAALSGGGRANPASAATTIAVDCTADPSALASALAGAADGDTLTIQGTCQGTFAVAHSVTLSGSGAATLDGQGAGSAVTIDPGVTAAINGLTITGGAAQYGSGVLNLGATVTLSNSTISANMTSFGAGAGIGNAEGGLITLRHSTVSSNIAGINSEGAGIENDNFSTVNVIDSTISNNDNSEGLHAGGIDNSGTVTITGSTISGNSSFIGGGIYNNGVLTITNSTISGNSATSSNSSLGGGGIYNNGGALTISASTLSGNSASPGAGAAIHDLAFATLTDTIVAGQSDNNCSLANAYGSITDGGFNLDDGATCGFSNANNSLSSTNPLLDPAGLMDNGGPTQTIALEASSPAIDAIPPGLNGCGTTVTTDQRGVGRPQGAGCDIGAFEVAPTVDLSIAKSGSPNPVVSGNRLTYAIRVTDNGPADASGVVVVDPLPDPLHFNSMSSSQGSCTRSTARKSPKNGTVTCSLGALLDGHSATITIVVTATTPGSLSNTASAGGNGFDPNPANNTATAVTTVTGT